MKQRRRHIFCAYRWPRLLACVWLALIVMTGSVLWAQDQTSRYVYDEKGRLRAVIAPNGEAAIYEYDPAGNFTGIRRSAATQVEILGFTPHEGPTGTSVTIYGTGFAAGVNSVSFNGANASITGTSPSTVVANVPTGAATGLITVVTPNGTASTTTPFTVRGVRVSPEQATVIGNETLQLAAVVEPENSANVVWSVNGVTGGNAGLGLITANGLYTAPLLPSYLPTAVFIIRATSVTTPALYGEARVTVRNPEFILQTLSAGVLVQKLDSAPPLTQPVVGAGVLVQKLTTDQPQLQPVVSPGVLVQRAETVQTPTQPVISTGVMVQRIDVAQTPTQPVISGGIMVQKADGSQPPTQPVIGNGLTVTKGPNITSVVPGSVAAGATVTVTLTGINFNGATALRFFKSDGTVDTGLTVTNLNINPNGTSLTATLAVNANSTAGPRVAVVVTPNGASVTANVNVNAIQITTAANKPARPAKPE